MHRTSKNKRVIDDDSDFDDPTYDRSANLLPPSHCPVTKVEASDAAPAFSKLEQDDYELLIENGVRGKQPRLRKTSSLEKEDPDEALFEEPETIVRVPVQKSTEAKEEADAAEWLQERDQITAQIFGLSDSEDEPQTIEEDMPEPPKEEQETFEPAIPDSFNAEGLWISE